VRISRLSRQLRGSIGVSVAIAGEELSAALRAPIVLVVGGLGDFWRCGFVLGEERIW
jgi:hypothetical protein